MQPLLRIALVLLGGVMSITWGPSAAVSDGRTTPGGHVASVPWGDTFALFASDPNGGIYGIKATPGFGWENVPGLTGKPGAPITALATGSQFVLFLADANGGVFTNTGAPYEGWSGWVSVSQGSITPGGHVAAVPWGDTYALFASDANGGIYGIKATPGFGWENVPGLTSTPGAPITALATGSQFVLFLADANGGVFTNTGAPYEGWSGWVSVSQGSTTPGGPVAAVPWGDTYALFASDVNGGIYGIKATPGFGWENVPGLTSTPGAPITALSWFPPPISDPNSADYPILLFTTNANGEILSTSGLPYQPWQPWSKVGNRPALSGATLTVASKLVGISPFSVFFADPAGEVFATTSVVLRGGTNAVLINNCENLSNLTVQLQVTEDLVTVEDLGFSLQLNSYPPIGAKTPNSTPETTRPGDLPGQLNWFQYLLIVTGNRISFEIQYWAQAISFQTGGPGGIPPEIHWPPEYTPDPLGTSPWLPVFPGTAVTGGVGSVSSNRVPAGSVITIQLATDSSANVTGATFSITDPSGKVQSASTQPWQHYAGQPEPSNYALFPIYGFQADLVSAPGLKCTFTSGAGTLTYSVSEGVLSVQTVNTCGMFQTPTGENSNIVYQEGVWPASGPTVRQSFAASPQG